MLLELLLLPLLPRQAGSIVLLVAAAATLHLLGFIFVDADADATIALWLDLDAVIFGTLSGYAQRESVEGHRDVVAG